MSKMNKIFIFTFCLQILTAPTKSYAMEDLILEDPDDIKLLMEEFPESETSKIDTETVTEVDDLEALKNDLKEVEFTVPKEEILFDEEDNKPNIVTGKLTTNNGIEIFETGREEKELLEASKKMEGKILSSEWNELAGATIKGAYTVVKNDWLWKISQRLFGSGFYYAKIWSLNPYITNPHEIEPGMVLTFDTGSQDQMPRINVGKYQEKEVLAKAVSDPKFDKWGDDAKPDWIDEKEKLKKQGVYVQYASLATDEDLKEISERNLIKEYESYEPPRPDFLIEIPEDQYDSSGFDKNAKVSFTFKEGFYLNTFLSTNVIQDFGKVDSAIEEKALFTQYDSVYLKFDDKIDVVQGDKYSIYAAQGNVSTKNSDREGYKYTIVASVKVVEKKGDKWLCDVIESAGVMSRGDRITVYTPSIDRITKTFNSRLIESVLIGSYYRGKTYPSFGDVIYIDRGRADGVEVGNIFEIYGFEDRGTGKNILNKPTYKNGEITIISLTDNFATALVNQSIRDFRIGDIAITKTKESAARESRLKLESKQDPNKIIDEQALEQLDVELNLDDLNDDLLDKADKIQLTDDELAEIEKQEREKSILSESEKDLKALERLENEVESSEKLIKESKLDEDRLLEGQSLDKIEKKLGVSEQESLEEIEENLGKKYLDEDLNDKDNPFGLTEFDIEEIDELLNVEKVPNE